MHGSRGACTAVKYGQDTHKYIAIQISNQI